MSQDQVTLVVFSGGRRPDSAPERLMAGAAVACALDLVEMALGCDAIDRVVVVTDEPALVERLYGRDRVVVDRDDPAVPFHFGRRLVKVVEAYRIQRPLYFGGSGAPLLSPAALADVCRRLAGAARTVVTNNVRSADFFGVTPPEALRRIDVPADQDNYVPFLLNRFAGLEVDQLDPAVENTFDVDTPSDLAILSLQGAARPHIRAYLDAVRLDASRYEDAMPFLVSQQAEITLAGRVATQIWGRSITDIPGPKRLYVEERGMKAMGKAMSRDAQGGVRSLLGYLLEAVGPERLFDHLASFSHAVFFDSRPILYHLERVYTVADRYASDLGDVDAIQNPHVRAFTKAALACRVPVILGGRNVVAGGLWALTQEAWNRADAGLITPTTG